MQATRMLCASASMRATHITLPHCIGHLMAMPCRVLTLQLCDLQVSPELGNSYSDVLAAQDVALYGGLCALASFDRSEIKRHVVESIGFREMLELNPEVLTPSRLSWYHLQLSQQEYMLPFPLIVSQQCILNPPELNRS